MTTDSHPAADHQPAKHVVQFYEDDTYLVDVVAPFLARGLASGESGLVLATGVHQAQIIARMIALGADVDTARRTGRLTLLDAHDVLAQLMVNGRPTWERFRAAIGPLVDRDGPPVRAFGEVVNILVLSGRAAAAIELEQLWNRFGETYPVWLLCGYHIDGFSQESEDHKFAAVCAAHDDVRATETVAQAVTDPDERRRLVALQRRARALEAEIARRVRAEADLITAEAERNRLLAQEQAARREAEAANRAKDEFLAMLGHELRNPLTPILTAVELLRMRGESSREVDVIERQAGHIARLVDDLLDVSRISRGNLEVRLARVELWDVVTDAIETASTLLEQRRHVLSIEVPRHGCAVDGDRVRLAQVVANLLTNAAKYSDAGSRIAVAVTAASGWVTLRVRDHGIGIAPEMVDQIFDAFVQQPQAIDRAHGGLGLGLAIVRSLVRLHGGTVTVTSDGAGRGSEFVVILPAAPVVDTATTQKMATIVPATGVKIMIVDDNADAALLLAAALHGHGYQVRVAHDGPAALALAAEFRPEVALVDIGLPVMDGYELAQRLRHDRATSAIELIAITGYGQDTDRARARAAGFAEHMMKPVDLTAVRRVITRATSR